MASDTFFFFVQIMGHPVDGFGGVQLENEVDMVLLGDYLGDHIL